MQALLHDTLTKLFKTQPEDPLAFLIQELQAEKQIRDQVASASQIENTPAGLPSSQKHIMNDTPEADIPKPDLPDFEPPKAEYLPADAPLTVTPHQDTPATEASATVTPQDDAQPNLTAEHDASCT